MTEDDKKGKEDRGHRPRYPQMQEKYEKIFQQERNRDRQEYRWYSVCTECSLLAKAQKEWPFVKTVGLAEQIRIPVERDPMGKDIQKTGMISDRELTAKENGTYNGTYTEEMRLDCIIDLIYTRNGINFRVGRNFSVERQLFCGAVFPAEQLMQKGGVFGVAMILF